MAINSAPDMKATIHKKEAWTAPVLTIYGSLEKLTGQNKVFGGDDGFTYMGTPIGNAS